MDPTLRRAEFRRDEFDQRSVRASVHGARRNAHLEATIVQADDLRAGRARLHMQLQDPSLARAAVPAEGPAIILGESFSGLVAHRARTVFRHIRD